MPINIDPSTKDLLTFWGAGLSTLLAGLKVWELWRDRFRLEVEYDFTSDRSIGNTVIIRNLSADPVTITHNELLVGSRRLFRWHLREIPDTDEPPFDITIAGHSSTRLVYRDLSHFSTSPEALKRDSIYIKMWIAGRRPMLKKVYSNGA